MFGGMTGIVSEHMSSSDEDYQIILTNTGLFHAGHSDM